MDTVEYARLLKTLLPPGDAWPHETDETSAFDGLIRALCVEHARVDAAALYLLDTIIPDNANTDLDAWERLVGAPPVNMTDEERLERIRGILRAISAVDRAAIQDAIRALSGYPGAMLYDRGRPSFVAGAGNAGDSCGEHGHQWLCELYPNTMAAEPDDFESWGSFDTVVNEDAQSPVTLDQTAASATFDGLAASVEFEAPDNAEGYASFWIKPAVDKTLYVQFAGRDSISTTPQLVDLTAGLWHRVEYRNSVGAGSSTPSLMLSVSGAFACKLSWAVAGIRDAALEARISALTQIHTRGLFGVQGEYATLLGQNQMEVSW